MHDGGACATAAVMMCSEYAAHHLLQHHHHHNRDLLAAAAAAQPEHLLQLQQQLASGADMHLDMLAYGNISSSEAAGIAGRVQQLLPAQGLASPDSWPPLGRVYSLSGLVGPEAGADREAAAGSDLTAAASCSTSTASASASASAGASAGAGGGGGPVTYLPDNPNPSNSNHSVYYWLQVGGGRQPEASGCACLYQQRVCVCARRASVSAPPRPS